MSHKKKLKEEYDKKLSVRASAKWQAGWKQKRPILLFAGGFFLLMAVFYVIWMSDYFVLKINPGIEAVNATLSCAVLNLIGQHTQSSNDLIISTTYSISVKRGCDAVEAMALFATAMLAFPMTWKKKLKGLLIGLMILFALNIVRIVTLFLTGTYAPRAFDIMHIEVWEALFIFFAITLWIYFIRQNKKTKVNAAV